MPKYTRRESMGITAAFVGGAAVAGSATGLTGCDTKKSIAEPARRTPVLAEVDVLVLGGGPAGMSAAIAAAREGVDVMLVERYGSFGGVLTQQTMGSIAWYRFEQTVDAGGVRLEYEQEAKEAGATLDVFGEEARGEVSDPLIQTYHDYLEENGLRVDGVPTYEILETELFKVVADKLLVDAGVQPLLHAWAVDAVMDGKKIKGAVIESKSGRQAILAEQVIDCTGDADVAHFAGASYSMQAIDKLMECTMQFGMSNVNLETLMVYMYLNASGVGSSWETGEATSTLMTPIVTEPYQRAIAAGDIPEEDNVKYVSMFGGYTGARELPDMNSIHLYGVNPLDVQDLTNAEIAGRQRALWAIDALKHYCPGFGKARMRTFASALGVRESRKIDGGYKITEDDVRNQARFDDCIGICPEFLDGFGLMLLPTTGRYFHVPFRSLLPEKIENLLVAGRSVDSDRISFSATRQMACCCVTGQGAGVAAAQAVKDGKRVRDVSISRVQSALEAQDVRIA